jgi:hypothetical protein
MRRLFLHAGTGKAGSSALQYAFSVESGRLSKEKIAYPESSQVRDRVLKGLPVPGNALAVWSALRARDPCLAFVEIQRLIGNSPHDVLLSNEGIYRATQDHLRTLCASLEKAHLTSRILLIFRPQVDLFASAYLQTLKRGTIEFRDQDHYASTEHARGRANWLLCAEKFESVFGKDHVRVCWYPALVRGRGVVAEAFNWLGVEPPPIDRRVINPTPGREAACVLMLANSGRLGGRRFADRFLAEAAKQNLLGSKVSLSESVARKIELECSDSNAELLRRYCPHLAVEEELVPVKITQKPIDQNLLARLKKLAVEVSTSIGAKMTTAQEVFS